MSTIHQVYCTHCTHGSSALERREGHWAHRMLGYSARAGSLEPSELRAVYRRIERYVSYYLPRDTSAEDRLRLTAATAPRRLLFLPSAAGLQIAAQVCYRATDTEGRPGSYFAHVLVRGEKGDGNRWSALDGARLWAAAGWVTEDSPQIPFRLPALRSLEEMLRGQRPAIDDALLADFLSAPGSAPRDERSVVIPPRWRQMTPDRRAALFIDAFSRCLDLQSGGRESLLLVAEPSIAALFAYGIARLLPAGAIRDGLSFSTFEAQADRLSTMLAATWLANPESTDLRPETVRARGAIVNTRAERPDENRPAHSPYAEGIVECLRDGGWDAVDHRLRSLEAVGARTPEDFHGLAAVDRVVPALLDPRLPLPRDDWRRSRPATEYLRKAVARRLAGAADPSRDLGPLVGSPAHLLILELIAVEPALPGTPGALKFLLGRLSETQTSELLKRAGVAVEYKVEALARHVASKGALPAGASWIWADYGRNPAAAGDRLLVGLLTRLPPAAMESLARAAGRDHAAPLLSATLHAVAQGLPVSSLSRVVKGLDDEALHAVLAGCGEALFRSYPENEPWMGQRLQAILASLPEHFDQFSERLELVQAGRALLPEDWAQDAATGWAGCQQAILDIGRLQQSKGGILAIRSSQDLDEAGRRMAEASIKAMPRDRFSDDPRGTWKQTRLRELGGRLLGTPLLPSGVGLNDAVWEKVARFYEIRRWPPAPLSSMQSKPFSGRQMILIALGAALLVVLAATLTALSGRGQRPASPQPEKAVAEVSERAESKPPSIPDMPAASLVKPDPLVAPSSPPIGRKVAEPSAAERMPAVSERPSVAKPDLAGADTQPKDEPTGRPESPVDAPVESPGGSERVAPVSAPTSPDESVQRLARWLQEARQAVARRDATLVDRQKVENGQAPFRPADALGKPANGGLHLGSGWVHLEGGRLYSFGEGFESRAPSSRHEVAGLAELYGLKSVAVEVLRTRDGVLLQVLATAKLTPEEATADLRAQIEADEKLRDDLKEQYEKWKKNGASKMAGAEERQKVDAENLAALLGLPLPGGREQAPRQAQARIDALERRIATGSKELEQTLGQIRTKGKHAAAEVVSACRQISAIIYQGAWQRDGNDGRPMAAEAPATPAKSLVPTVPEVSFDLKSSRQTVAPERAQLGVSLAGQRLNVFRQQYVVSGKISYRDVEGKEIAGTEQSFEDIEPFDRPVLLKTGRVDLQVTFALRRKGEPPLEVARSGSFEVALQPGMRHSIKVVLNDQAQATIRKLKQ